MSLDLFLREQDWPIDTAYIDEAVVRCTLEYLTGQQRITFFNELHRVMKPDGQVRLYLPYYASMNAYSDPYLVWPPFTEHAVYYLASKSFRDQNTPHYNQEMKADFSINYGYSYTPSELVRHDKARDDRVLLNLNVVQEMVMTLRKL